MEIEIKARAGGPIRPAAIIEMAENMGLQRVNIVTKEGWAGDHDRTHVLTFGLDRKTVYIPVLAPEAKVLSMLEQAVKPRPNPEPSLVTAKTHIEPPQDTKPKRGRKPKSAVTEDNN